MPDWQLALASAYAERLNFGVLKGLTQRRAMVRVGAGEPPPAAPGLLAHMLAEQTERGKNGTLKQVTAIGHRMAVRRLPPVLATQDHVDPVRVVPEIYATAAEKLGSVAGRQSADPCRAAALLMMGLQYGSRTPRPCARLSAREWLAARAGDRQFHYGR